MIFFTLSTQPSEYLSSSELWRFNTEEAEPEELWSWKEQTELTAKVSEHRDEGVSMY